MQSQNKDFNLSWFYLIKDINSGPIDYKDFILMRSDNRIVVEIICIINLVI